MKNFIATTVLALVAAINAPASAHHDGHHGHHGHHGGHHQMHQPQQRVVWSQVYTYHIGNARVCYNSWRAANPTYRILTYNGYTVQYQIPTYLPPVHCPPPVVHCPPVVVQPPVCYPQQTVIISGGSCNRVVYRRRSSCTTFSFGFSW